ncbi:flagellar hook-length control protein FliK [Sporohalobacter salinus]|uniref:flagellar hook-length control protein FliK n=1 Tax=Sporohalobacter salinus TaxID=1494606 RepID=UPI00195FCF6B|nr:flagellar hook-length control protein FliK [Sporohalobacter salinus]MBM7623419.1 hypothetical protein [Sporohalobacter salinus]
MKLFSNSPLEINLESINKIEKSLTESLNQSVSDNNSTYPQELSSKKIDNILTELGLLHTDSNEKIIRSLLKYQLPLNKELIINIKQLLNNHPENFTKALKAIIFLKKANLKINHSSIKLLINFLTQEPNIATELKSLIKHSPNKIANKLTRFILQPDQKNRPFTAKEVKKKIMNLGLNFEKNLLIKETKKSNNFKAFLFDLKNNNSQISNKIIDNVIYNLTNQKLIMHQNEKSGTIFLYLQLPLQFNNYEFVTAHLNIFQQKKKSNSKKENTSSFCLVLNLETEKLGIMNIKLNFYNKKLNISINTNSEKTLKLIESKIKNLKTKITNLGCDIQNITLATINTEDIQKNIESEILKTNPLNFDNKLHNIDFTI